MKKHMSMRQGDRLHALDAWRGIAALLVALYRLEADGWLHSLSLVQNAYMFVDFFFVLSGFVISHAYLGRLGTGKSTLIFLIRRFGRVWPLHAALLAVFVLFELARGVYGLTSAGTFDAFSGYRSPVTILWDGLLVQSLGLTGATGWNTPAWSISTEFWTYVLFTVLCLCGRKTVAALAPPIIVVSISVVALKSPMGMDTTFDYGFARCLAGFFSGLLIQQIWQRLSEARLQWADPYGLIELIVIGIAWLFVAIAGRSWLSFLAPIAFAPLVFVFAFERGPVSRLLSGATGQLLGQLSYSIYMTALIISLAFNKAAIFLFEKLGNPISRLITINGHEHVVFDLGFPILNDMYAILYLASVVGILWLTSVYIEQPARVFFNRLSSRFA